MAEALIGSKHKDLEIQRLTNELAARKKDAASDATSIDNWRLEAQRFRTKWIEAETQVGYWKGQYKAIHGIAFWVAIAAFALAAIAVIRLV